MTKYFKYLHYVLKHKYYVFIECCKLGIPLLGIIHDWSKLRPSEFFPYANHFFGPGSNGMQTGRDKSGCYDPWNLEDIKFKFALFLHLKRNKHHWQWWILSSTNEEKLMEMPDKYFKEMLADWKAAARRSPDKSLEDTLDYAFKKYGIGEQLGNMIRNTLKDLKWIKETK